MSAALGACTTMTLRLYAERKGWPLTRVRVSVLHHRASLAARDLFDVTISLEGDLDEAQKAQMMLIAERCPVHRTLTAAVSAEPSLAAPPEHMRDAEAAGEA
jgi:putative redox protein